MVERAWENIPAMFLTQAAARGEAPLFALKQGEAWVTTSWSAAAAEVRALGAALIRLGCVPGSRVAIIADNEPAWAIADLAIMAAGCITVPTYTTYTTEDHRHVLADSGAEIVIIGSAALGQRVMPAVAQLSGVRAVIARAPLAQQQSAADIHSWDEALALGADGAAAIEAGTAAIQPDDTACLIYTSGTGGLPKGVMLTHRNMLSNAAGAKRVLESAFRLENERFLSFSAADAFV